MTYEKPLKELVKPDWLSEEDWRRALEKVESAKVIKRDAKAHLDLYQKSKGKEGFELAGCAVLLLTTVGRKSGNQVTTPLNFLELDGSYVVVGSLGGMAEDPGGAEEPTGTENLTGCSLSIASTYMVFLRAGSRTARYTDSPELSASSARKGLSEPEKFHTDIMLAASRNMDVPSP